MAPTDIDSLVMPNLDFDPDGKWDMLRSDVFVPALYADCSPDDVALASSLLSPEPSAPSLTPVRTTPDRFGRIRRVFIELTEDRAVTPRLQRTMSEAVGCDDVIPINASHSAYFSKPDELAGHLDAISRTA